MVLLDAFDDGRLSQSCQGESLKAPLVQTQWQTRLWCSIHGFCSGSQGLVCWKHAILGFLTHFNSLPRHSMNRSKQRIARALGSEKSTSMPNPS